MAGSVSVPSDYESRSETVEPRPTATRCISHIILLLIRYSEDDASFPRIANLSTVEFARRVVTWYKEKKDMNDQTQEILGQAIAHLEDYIEVSILFPY